MALPSTIRKIPLQANCDLAKFNQDLHNYTGFAECNSLFMNKRMVNWMTRKVGTDDIGNGLVFKTNGDEFDIYKEGSTTNKLFSVNRTGYKTEVVEEVPSGIKQITAPDLGFILPDGTSVFNEDKVVKYVAGDYTVYMPVNYNYGKAGQTVYTYKGNEFVSSINTSGCWKGTTALPVITSVLYLSDDIVLDSRTGDSGIFLKKETPYMMIIDSTANVYATRNGSYTKTNGNELIINLITGEVLSFYRDGVYFNSSSFSYEPVLYSFMPYNSGFVQVEQNISTGIFTVYIKDSAGNIVTQSQYSYDDYECICSCQRLYTSAKCPADVVTEGSGEVYKKIKRTAYGRNGIFAYQIADLEEIVPTQVASIVDVVNTTEIKRTEILYGHNMTRLYGKWAINYTFVSDDAESLTSGEFVADNIAHNYKKIIYLENGLDDVLGYDDESIYFTYKNNKYKLSLTEFETPSVQLVGDLYTIFNTTSYINAIYTKGTDFPTFCSCDDWNNRMLTYNKYNGGSIVTSYVRSSSRIGNDATSISAIETVSDKINSSKIEVGTLSGEVKVEYLNVYYCDGNYTTPEDVSYTVYLPAEVESGSTAQTLYHRAKINGTTLTAEEVETDIWTDGDTESIEEVPPLLFCTYLVMTTKRYVQNQHATYELLNNQSEIPLLLYSEQVTISDDSFSQFVINGSLYTFYDKTSKVIQDADGNTICDASSFKYIGYSSKAAYFFCLFDNGIYVFSGDNSLQRLFCLEKYQVKYDDKNLIQTINIPSIDLIVLNLGEKALVFFNDQMCIVSAGEQITTMNYNSNSGTFRLNAKEFTLIPQTTEVFEVEPIEIETEFYGAVDSKQNMINDCVYITVDNLNTSVSEGYVKVYCKTLFNNQINTTVVKTYNLKASDFNSSGVCQIKYQPPVQECYGFKLILETNLELFDLSIGTSAGSMVQTQYKM